MSQIFDLGLSFLHIDLIYVPAKFQVLKNIFVEFVFFKFTSSSISMRTLKLT